MPFNLLLLARLVSFAAVAFANNGPRPATTRCYTGYGNTKQVHGLHTTSLTSYTPCTQTTTKTSTKTSTAKSTVTITVTKVKTVTTASTATPPATFLPIQDTLPDSFYNPADNPPGGSSPASKRALFDEPLQKRGNRLRPGSGYPETVSCWEWTHSQCHTTTSTATSYKIEASKQLPTITSTVHSTTTSYTSTVYPACATTNFANQVVVDGSACYLDSFGGLEESMYGGDDVSLELESAYDCCVFAESDPHGPLIWAFLTAEENNAPVHECIVLTTGNYTCPAQSQSSFGLGCEYDTADSTVVFGNGYCGEVTTVTAPSQTPTGSSAPSTST